MNDTLKQKSISGFSWSFLDTVASHGLNFVYGIVLARILLPADFGLVGMVTIFIAISNSFILGGFKTALIRKKDCSPQDYSTVFFYNITLSVLFYFILYLCSNFLSYTFSEPQLQLLIKVMAISLVFNSLGIVPEIILLKKIDFKSQAIISLITSLCYGSIAITMAILGYGVWSLVALFVSRFVFRSLFLWIWSSWRPAYIFSRKSFMELFRYSSKIMISNLMDVIYNNLYYLVIGKFFSAVELGYYIKADQFGFFPARYLNSIFTRVSFSILSDIQEDKNRFKEVYRKILRSMMLITFLCMFGIAAIAKPLIIVLIGHKWLPAVIYIQMLCFSGIFFPIISLNSTILLIYGRSDIFLKLEIIKKMLAIPVIIIGIIFGIKIMIAGMIVNSLIAYYLNSYWSGKLTGYSFFGQVKDILPSFLLASGIGTFVFMISKVSQLSPLSLLVIQVATTFCLAFVLFELFKISDYLFLKKIVLDKWGRGEAK